MRRVQAAFCTPENFRQMAKAAQQLAECVRAGGKILACGNGGSLCDAAHFAEELTGRYRENRPPVGAIALNDPGHLSCTANDYGYAQVFARAVEALGRRGDVLVALSTSGNSANVVKAAQYARQNGIYVLALTGNNGGELARHADLELRVPHTGYADRIQEVHIQILHVLIERLEALLFAENPPHA